MEDCRLSSERSERIETTRLKGSGTIPRFFAFAVLAAATIFIAVWLSSTPSALPVALILELLALALAVRSLFVGAFLAGDGILVRGWFRDFRYGPDDLTRVDVVPYWKFLDPKDPILSLLTFRPASGWVREVAATVAWKDRTLTHAAEIRRHLGLAAVKPAKK